MSNAPNCECLWSVASNADSNTFRLLVYEAVGPSTIAVFLLNELVSLCGNCSFRRISSVVRILTFHRGQFLEGKYEVVRTLFSGMEALSNWIRQNLKDAADANYRQ